MKTAIAIRHVAFEDLGCFGTVLERAGFRISYLDAAVDDLTALDAVAADLLVVLGGPIGVYEERAYPFLAHELALLERRLAANRATLGICLGCQLLARVLGARVYPGGGKEIGWAPLTLTDGGRQSPLRHLSGGQGPVLHWHGDTFELPDGAVRLASTPQYENQAFSWNEAVLALQFHPEVTAAGLERWFVGHACEIEATPGLSVEGLRADTQRWVAELQPRGQACLEEWLAGLPALGIV